ncbi:MAG: DsrE family protein [Gammaproteobacteria bacterium]|nr:DsrE family protein [Gammaproteobacteria bacterium]
MPVFAVLLSLVLAAPAAHASGKVTFPEYGEPKVVFDVFLADPRHITAALSWVRSYMNPLTESPYDLAPELMEIVVVIHGTEIVTLAQHNYEKYRDSVERMRYYASLGVQFKVCGLAASDYGYSADTFYDFVEIVPSAMVEVADLQRRGFGLVMPLVHEKHFSVEDIR